MPFEEGESATKGPIKTESQAILLKVRCHRNQIKNDQVQSQATEKKYISINRNKLANSLKMVK